MALSLIYSFWLLKKKQICSCVWFLWILNNTSNRARDIRNRRRKMERARQAGSPNGQWQGCSPVKNSQVPKSQICRSLVSSQGLRSPGNWLNPRKQRGKESEDTGSLRLPYPWQGPLGLQDPCNRGKAAGPEEAVGRKRGRDKWWWLGSIRLPVHQAMPHWCSCTGTLNQGLLPGFSINQTSYLFSHPPDQEGPEELTSISDTENYILYSFSGNLSPWSRRHQDSVTIAQQTIFCGFPATS
jgi:hypothetical protein